MKVKNLLLSILLGASALTAAAAPAKPWDHGPLEALGQWLRHTDGTPFFWLGDTGWLLPERLDRDEAKHYLTRAAAAGYNVVLVQTVDGVPAYNRYGESSMPFGFDFSFASEPGRYTYWHHMDYIIDAAERNGIYIGMVPIWGNLVKEGKMTVDEAKKYGEFLANRYKDKKNIVWVIGGDIQGNIKPEVWDTLARTIKSIDKNHIMTYHPRGRHTSAQWFADRDWLDFHMYQSGHRRYNQRMGNAEYPIQEGTEEDVWMYVDSTRVYDKVRPVLDGEPSYENIPQGLHGANEPLWNDRDVRRYAYWDVFAGCCGHTYGHNNIMQFVRPGVEGSYFADGEKKPWYVAQRDAGYNQMKHVRNLMLTFPYFERVADQSVIRNNGKKYDRLSATRGADYLLVYNHTGRRMDIDLSKISGKRKKVWWMNAATGALTPLGTAGASYTYTPAKGTDGVLIVFDEAKSYIRPDQTVIEAPKAKADKKDLTE